MSEAVVSGTPKVFVSMLGGCAVEVDGRVVAGAPSNFFRVAAYLVLNGGAHSVSRQRLSALLWPDLDQEKSGANLRQVVARIKRFQEQHKFQFIGANFSSLFIIKGGGVQCDLSDLLGMLSNGGIHSVLSLCSLYTGDLLADLPDSGSEYEDWLFNQRERLRGRLTSVLLDAISPTSQVSDADRHAAANCLLELDPACEPACRVLMTDAAHRDDIAGMHDLYRACSEHLMGEYGVAPSVETQGLYDRLIREHGAP